MTGNDQSQHFNCEAVYIEVIQGCQTGYDGKEWGKWELMGQMGNYAD